MDSHHEAPTEPVARGYRPSNAKNTVPVRPQAVTIRRRRPLLSFLLFLLGIMLGILGTLTSILFGAHDRAPLQISTSTQPSSLSVQVSSSYLSQLVSRNIRTAGMPGNVSNVQVTLSNDSQIQITGQDTFNLFVVSVTRPFTITLQAYTQSCQPRVRLLHADLGDIPVTNFAQNYEDRINQEIQFKVSGLPAGFTYCAVGTSTQANALSIRYTATPA